jgi:YD repeat-containing protein
LPYAEQSINDGSYKTAAKTNQGNFYKVGGGWDATVMKTGKPFAETVFENSPLNRLLEQGATGDAWQPATSRTITGRTVVTDYGTNVASGTEAVKLWMVNTNNVGATGATNYLAGKLYKTTTKDENWVSGKAGTVDEYKDFEDRVVLKRVWESESKKLDTYYVYDDFWDLRFVIPPGFPATTTTITENDATLNELIYAYKYDGRRRLIEKKIPGKGLEWIVYNVNDQVVLTQDAVQRTKTTKEWSYTKYDAFGRVTETGIYRNNGLTTLALAQSAVDAVTQY